MLASLKRAFVGAVNFGSSRAETSHTNEDRAITSNYSLRKRKREDYEQASSKDTSEESVSRTKRSRLFDFLLTPIASTLSTFSLMSRTSDHTNSPSRTTDVSAKQQKEPFYEHILEPAQATLPPRAQIATPIPLYGRLPLTTPAGDSVNLLSPVKPFHEPADAISPAPVTTSTSFTKQLAESEEQARFQQWLAEVKALSPRARKSPPSIIPVPSRNTPLFSSTPQLTASSAAASRASPLKPSISASQPSIPSVTPTRRVVEVDYEYELARRQEMERSALLQSELASMLSSPVSTTSGVPRTGPRANVTLVPGHSSGVGLDATAPSELAADNDDGLFLSKRDRRRSAPSALTTAVSTPTASPFVGPFSKSPPPTVSLLGEPSDKGLFEWRRKLAAEREAHTLSKIEESLRQLRLLSEKRKEADRRLHEETERRIRQKEEEARRAVEEKLRKKRERPPPLTRDEQVRVQQALERDDEDVVVSGFNIHLRRSDLALLRDTEWLNDEVVNFYMNLLQDRAKRRGDRVYFFNTFFYPKLTNANLFGGKPYDYASVRSWTRKIDAFAYDKLVVPVHLGNHWCLAVINFKEKRFEYYDSMGGSNERCLRALRQWVLDEWRDKKKTGTPPNLDEWTNYTATAIPTQKNGYDCGVFMCKYADYLSRDMPLAFRQSDMPTIRKRMMLEILNKVVD